jgi:uncharacterized membrane protein
MVPIFLSLLAFTSWGTGDIFNIITARKINPTSATYWNLLLRAVAYVFAIPFFISNLLLLDTASFITMLVSGLASAFGYVFFMRASKLTNPALVISIAGSWGALSVLESIFILGERISLLQTITIMTIFIGLFFVTFNIEGIKKIKIIEDKGIWLAFIAMFLWSICGTFIKIPIQKIGWFWPTYFLSLPFAIGALIFGRKTLTKGIPKTKNKALKPFLLAVMLTIIGEISYNLAISVGLIAIIASISGSYAILSIALSFLLFREPISSQQKLGIATTILGIVFLSIVSI